MIKKIQLQDYVGDIICFHTTSDVVIDDKTGVSVRDEIASIKLALGLGGENGGNAALKIDATTIRGKTIDDLVLKETYDDHVVEIKNSLDDIDKRITANRNYFELQYERCDKTTVFEDDNTITVLYSNGYKSISTISDTSIVEKIYNERSELIRTKTTIFNDDDSITETVVDS